MNSLFSKDKYLFRCLLFSLPCCILDLEECVSVRMFHSNGLCETDCNIEEVLVICIRNPHASSRSMSLKYFNFFVGKHCLPALHFYMGSHILWYLEERCWSNCYLCCSPLAKLSCWSTMLALESSLYLCQNMGLHLLFQVGMLCFMTPRNFVKDHWCSSCSGGKDPWEPYVERIDKPHVWLGKGLSVHLLSTDGIGILLSIGNRL